MATVLMLTDLRVKEYTISIQTHLCTGYKLPYRVREEGSGAIKLMLKDPKGQKVHGQHYKLTSVHASSWRTVWERREACPQS